MIKKAMLITFFMYLIPTALYAITDYLVPPEPSACLGWVCDKVMCPDDYAIWIPQHGGFLPCESFDEYIKTKDVGLLR